MLTTGTISAILRLKGKEIWSVDPESTVFDALLQMTEKNVGALLVMEGERLVGVLSERDYARKVMVKGKSSKQTKVREILSTPVTTATPFNTVEECMHLMTSNRVRHLPVLEANKVVGIVSIGDLVNWIITAQDATINQLENYISGHPS